MTINIPSLIVENIPKTALIEMYDSFIATASKSNSLVKDGSPLKGSGANKVVGMMRYEWNKYNFERICPQFGGLLATDGCLEKLGIKVFQPFHEFGPVILGFASHFKAGELPTKNMSRMGACELNFGYEPILPGMGLSVVPSKLFALLLLSRDSRNAGKVAGVEIAVIDSAYDHFIFREPLKTFLSRYADASGSEEEISLVSLKETTLGIALKSRDE